MKNIQYPEQAECFCGNKSMLKYKNVKNEFENKTITIYNVPVYECQSLHNDMTRITRVKLRKLMRDNPDEIYLDYED